MYLFGAQDINHGIFTNITYQTNFQTKLQDVLLGQNIFWITYGVGLPTPFFHELMIAMKLISSFSMMMET